jgi:8-oxo-dGTP pyrophosphatase MutT (NUDIX family)
MDQKDPASAPPRGRRGAVAVVLRADRFLVIRRSAHVVAPRAMCFPGGAVEPGESDEQALAREFQEELGVAIRPVARLWHSTTPWHVQLSWWQGEIPHDVRFAPNPAEVEAVHWLTSTEMLALPDLLSSNREFLAALAAGQIVLDEADRRRR